MLVLTSAAVSLSITLLSKAAFASTAVDVLVPLKLTPRPVNCAAVTAVPPLLAPSARARTAFTEVTRFCTSAVVSVAVEANAATLLLSSVRLVAVTPVTPAPL